MFNMGSDLFEWVYGDKQTIRNLTKRDDEDQKVYMETKQNQLIGGVGSQLSFRPLTLPCSVYDNDYGVWTEWANDKKYCEEDCERKARQIRSCTSKMCSPGEDNRIISKKCRCPTLTEFGPPDEPSSKPDIDFCIINNGYGSLGYVNNLYSLRLVFILILKMETFEHQPPPIEHRLENLSQ